MVRKVIIDCDPGQDDAVALFLAFASRDELEIMGITTVAGNVPRDKTTLNARLICDVAGITDIPVFAGCDRPMKRELVTAEHVHGETGIDGFELTEPHTPRQTHDAVDFLIQELRLAKDVTLVPTGPLTNIATAFEHAPDIIENVHEIVLMGGAMREGGNISPSAEFNILVDPHAAEIVLNCGRPITMMGLDVTHKVISTRKRVARIKALENRVADATAGMLSFFHRHDSKKYGTEGGPLHDPCTVAFLLMPELFKSKLCNVSVETESELTMGHTSVDFWGVTDRKPNVLWVYDVDAEGFYDLLTERLSRFDHLPS